MFTYNDNVFEIKRSSLPNPEQAIGRAIRDGITLVSEKTGAEVQFNRYVIKWNENDIDKWVFSAKNPFTRDQTLIIEISNT